ncbi:hypothetical protein PFISCL1PPCAC_25698, partial [Pristionchus fissidentatus]
GNRPVQCLLCPKKLVVRELDEHLHKHFDYYPQKCGSCDFESVRVEDLEQHVFDLDHVCAAPAEEPYKKWLVRTLRSDTLEAAKKSVEEVLRGKKEGVSQPATPSSSSTHNLPSSSHSTPLTTREATTTRRKEKQPMPPKSSSEDEEEEEKEPTPPPRSAQKKKKRAEEDEESKRNKVPPVTPSTKPRAQCEYPEEEEFDEDIKPLKAKIATSHKCTLCKELVNYTLSNRQKHVRQKHMAGVDRAHEEVFRERLEKQTALAFPALASKWTQCALCFRSINSITGRTSHVSQHIHHNYLKCPFDPCIFSTNVQNTMQPHLVNCHNIQRGRADLGEEHADFLRKSMEFKSKVETMISLLFSVELIPSKGKGKKRGAGEDDDDDEEEVDLSQLKNNPPTKPTPPTRPTTQRRRDKSSSVSSDTSSSSEDEEEKKKKAKKKEEVKKEVKKSIDKSDGEEEEDSDEEMADAKSVGAASSHSTASITGASSHKSEVKSETPPDVETKKEEIKREEQPVTPRAGTTTTSSILPFGDAPVFFQPRKIALPEGDASHITFPSEHEEAEKRRREREGKMRGGGGGRG